MNEINVILIQPIANGFIVTLPNFRDYNLELQKRSIDYALEVSGQKDKFLGHSEIPKAEQLLKTENVYQFDSMEKVLAFLAGKYVG